MATIVLILAIVGVCVYILYPLFAQTTPHNAQAEGGRTCPDCGKPAREKDRFCSACGARLR